MKILKNLTKLLLPALFAVSCASSLPPTEPAYSLSDPIESSSFRIPSTLAGFQVYSISQYPDPELGFQVKLRFSSDSKILADIYVYPVLLPDLMSLADMLDFEQEKLEEGIRYVSATKDQESTDPILTTYVPPKDGLLPAGYYGIRTIEGPRFQATSHSFLTLNHDLYFKVRITVPIDSSLPSSRVTGLIDALSESVPPPARRTRKLSVVVTRTTHDFAAEGNVCALSAWILYGVAMQEAVASGKYLGSFDRELTARSAALDYWDRESREPREKACESLALSSMSKSREHGFLREYVWSAYRQRHWLQPPNLELEAFDEWAQSNLSEHDPIVFPGVLIRWAEPE